MFTCKIYVLKNPVTNMIFYVGKTTLPIHVRLIQHISKARTKKYGNKKLTEYINSLKGKPVIQVIDTILCNNDRERHLDTLEMFWINGLKNCGLPLVNKIFKVKQ